MERDDYCVLDVVFVELSEFLLVMKQMLTNVYCIKFEVELSNAPTYSNVLIMFNFRIEKLKKTQHSLKIKFQCYTIFTFPSFITVAFNKTSQK